MAASLRRLAIDLAQLVREGQMRSRELVEAALVMSIGIQKRLPRSARGRRLAPRVRKSIESARPKTGDECAGGRT